MNLGHSGNLTRTALLWMKLTSEPLVALYTLLPFILIKDFGASALQISIFAALKPVLAVLAYYLSAHHVKNGKSTSQNLIHAWVLAYLPFIFFPWFGSYAYLLLAASFYQIFSKAATPPLMELLKQNIPKTARENLFSKSYMFCFGFSMFLGLFIGKLLDRYDVSWLLALSSLLALTSFHIQRKIPHTTVALPSKYKNPILDPLRESLTLMNTNRDFKQFQIGFMIGGSALMFMTSALPIYLDALHLSHEKVSTARFIFMAVGVLVSSMVWKNFLHKSTINKLMPWITIGFGLYPLCVLGSNVNLAFLIYGVAQAGSHLIWNLSGTIFAKDGNSAPYTAINILSIGLRGLFVPFLGGLACTFFGPVPVIVIGSVTSFIGAFVMYRSAYVAHTKQQALK